MEMDLAVEGGLETEAKEVTNCQARAGNHPIAPAIPMLLYRQGPLACTHPWWGSWQPPATSDAA